VSEAQRLFEEDGVRATTAFNRTLSLPGASVTGVRFADEGVIVMVRLRRRRRVCSRCGQVCRASHDTVLCRWRHLDLGGQRCFITAWLRRVKCPDCGVRVEAVPWARGPRFTREFEDVVAYLAQQMAKDPIARLMRIAWDTVGRIVDRVVAERLDGGRLHGLARIGVDEVSYRRRHRYLTVVADHDSGRIVWVRKGRNSATLQAFFDELGDRRQSIRAVSIDMSGDYQRAIRQAAPQAEIAFDRSTSSASAPTPSTRSAATSGTRTSARIPPPGAGSSTRAGRCSRRPTARTSTSSARSARSISATAGSTAPSCSTTNCGCSTRLKIRRSRRRTWTPGLAGPRAPGSLRSSKLPAPCAATARASSPPSASGCPTAASKASTAACV
jgi:transposase